MSKETVVEAIGETLVRRGVGDVFGVIGSGNLVLANAMRDAGATFWHTRHEGGAVSAADAYGRVTGDAGVCTVHQGPGLTNTMTALTEAAKSRTPMLVLAADVPSSATRSNFALDQAGLARVAGARYERVSAAGDAPQVIYNAEQYAFAERRPVVVGLPLDVQPQRLPAGAEVAIMPFALPLPAPPPADVRLAADILAGARRPVVIAGRGAVLSNRVHGETGEAPARHGPARAAIERLGDAVGALYATSAVAKGFFAGSPYDVGISGGFASPLAARLIADADVVVSFGASLNLWTTRHGGLIGADTQVIQVDIDRGILGAHRPAELGICADVLPAADAIAAELEARGERREGHRRGDVAEEIKAHRWRDEPYDDASTADTIDPRTLSIALDDSLPAERTVAVDSGHFMGYPAMYLSVPDPAAFVFTQAFQSVGLGVSSAVGAAVARPDRLTVAAVGDGGLLMSLGELETAVRLGLRLLVVVYDDAAYGAEVHHFGPSGEDVDVVRFRDTDFAALARALGAYGWTVRARGDLAAAGEWLTAPDGVALIDAKVTPHVCAEWLEEAFRR
ncbi:MAG: thiamine pyrophosphate-binding protein [Streptosporangiaceae bacterium]